MPPYDIPLATAPTSPTVVGQPVYRFNHHIVPFDEGRQDGVARDGTPFKFVECVSLASGNMHGSCTIPVLPNGNVVMVVEQRGPLSLFPGEFPRRVQLASGRVIELGLNGSLEFPGGAHNPGEHYKSGVLREVFEELGVNPLGKKVSLYTKSVPVLPFGSDMAHANFIGWVSMPDGIEYPQYVKIDGGLAVYMFTPAEVDELIDIGIINSGQAALNAWQFYTRCHVPQVFESLYKQGLVKIDHVELE